MMNAMKLVTWMAAVGATAACSQKSEKYCAMHPEDVEVCGAPGVDGGPDDAPDGMMGCTTNDACADPTPVCDGDNGACVQCLPDQAAACGGTTPVCVDTTCQPCSTHAECASNACMPDGSCADEATVAYVSATGTATSDCSKATPCTTVTRALMGDKAVIKIEGDIVEPAQVTLANRDVTLIAETTPQAQISRAAGPILVVDGSGNIEIHGLQIADATNVLTGIGLTVNPGFTGTFVADRLKIYGNDGGGLYVQGTGKFTITNSVIAHNGTAVGSPKSTYGGVVIINDSIGSRFEWNTIAFNTSSGTTFRGGISCNAPTPSASGNLIYRNGEPDGMGGIEFNAATQRNDSGGCNYGTSAAIVLDPGHLGFVKPLEAPFDFHLSATSPATVVDAGGACTGTDLDRDGRPQGSGCDLGADEAR